MFPRPRPPPLPGSRAVPAGRWRSRVRGLPEVIGELPVATLPTRSRRRVTGRSGRWSSSAATPCSRRPTATGWTPPSPGWTSWWASTRTSARPRATPTSILPPPGPLERSHYDLAFTGFVRARRGQLLPRRPRPRPTGSSTSGRSCSRWRRSRWGSGRPIDLGAADAFVARTAGRRWSPTRTRGRPTATPTRCCAAVGDRRGPERLLDLLLRPGPTATGSARRRRPDPGARSRPSPTASTSDRSRRGSRTKLDDRRPAASSSRPHCSVAASTRWSPTSTRPSPTGWCSIGRRHLRTNNSWCHNVAGARRGRSLCTLQVHPDDAAAAGLADGGRARVRSPRRRASSPTSR